MQDGYTPLHVACEGGYEDVALMLIEHGANVTDKDMVREMTDEA